MNVKTMSKIDTSELQRVITGRVVPHIYSFLTNTLPNYLKVGDTYRPVDERLNEWRKYYKDLQEVSRHKATINDEVFFRDHAVHNYLIRNGIAQVPFNASKKVHSKEFFEGAKGSDVTDAVGDIANNYQKTDTYDYYNNLKEVVEFHYNRTQDFAPRENQQKVLDNFGTAIKNDRDNLLMYAVMRFGKSITSIWCAKKMKAKLTVVVSAKADVSSEWKYTVESHKDFKGYRFIDKTDLKKGVKLSGLYGKKFKTGSGDEEVCTSIVLFLTLQDLAGSTDTIKNHHKILRGATTDLLIIDETHFGARAPVLGKILAGVEIDEEEKELLKKDKEDPVELGALGKLPPINAEIKLHLSGTPYRILMGSEFTQEDIIAFVQFSDIYEAKLRWSIDHLDENEWENPYYGFPQMIRFAFNPNESSRQRLADIPGSKPAELFTPVSISKKGDYNKFKYEQEVIDLLQVLDGTKNDANMLGLLDNETVKTGKLAQHIVMVLPYRASCDALARLITKNRKLFKNIAEYKLLNISGYDQTHKTPEEVKSALAKAAQVGKKTITFTVNKMLTGSTVPQWDTMIYLKGTASPQEYDQAIFRLQSAWIEKYKDEKGDVIKYDMKPQTLLVDLDPTRLFYLQEMKAFTYGANTQDVGNENIEKSIERELRISPIITLNAERNKLVEVTATVIIDQVRKYANERTITEDVQDIGIDASLKENPAIFELISKLAELGGKSGLNIQPNKEEGEDIDGEAPDTDTGGTDSPAAGTSVDTGNEEDISSFEKRFRTYYVMILLFAFLSETEEKTLTDVINNIDANEDNRRIARNLGLKKSDLMLIRDHINPFVRSALDYKIQNADFRSYDATISPVDHIDIAIHKFGRLSAAEVFTPPAIVSRMYDSFNVDFWRDVKDSKILDIASKSGSFAKGFVEKAIQHGATIEDIKDNFFSIPTSSAAYEFTRKMYQALGLNIDNIARNFTSFDLIKLSEGQLQYLLSQDKKFCNIALSDLESYNDWEKKDQRNMKFKAIVGNPPYQENTGNSRDNPIYPEFMNQAYDLSDLVCLITPARFLFNAGQTSKKWNEKMRQDQHLRVESFIPKATDIFPNASITGGIVITLRDANKILGPIGNFTPSIELNTILYKILAQNFQPLSQIVFGNSTYKFTDKLYVDYPSLLARSKPSEKRSIGTNVFNKLPEIFSKDQPKNGDYMRIYGREADQRTFMWVRHKYIADHPNLKKWKVFLPKSNGAGSIGEVATTALIGEPLVGGTQTFISFGVFDTKIEAQNCMKFIKTKFARALLGTLKITQHNSKPAWKNVPLQDFTKKSDIDWSKSIPEMDKQLYKKYGLDKKEIDFIETHVKSMT